MIIKLIDENNKLCAINKDRLDTPATKRKIQESQCMLASTFKLWPPNVETLIKNEEDRSFLKSMKTDRAASFGPLDKVLAQKVSKCNRHAAFCLQLKTGCNISVSQLHFRCTETVGCNERCLYSRSCGI